MNKKLIERIQELFFIALEGKTNWGRNEIKDMYKGAVTQALLEHLDQQEKDPDAGKDVDSNTPDDIF
jgi:hypothetical protein